VSTDEKKSCLSPIAKVEAIQSLNVFYNRRREEIAQRQAKGEQDPAWAAASEIRVKRAEEAIGKILEEIPDCPDEEFEKQ